mgnify:CR=1 FL=1
MRVLYDFALEQIRTQFATKQPTKKAGPYNIEFGNENHSMMMKMRFIFLRSVQIPSFGVPIFLKFFQLKIQIQLHTMT